MAAPATAPIIASIAMGYGHLRPAVALADAFGVPVLRADAAPVASDDEIKLWTRIRRTYEATTRWTGLSLIGPALRELVEFATSIPHLHPHRDQSRPGFAVRRLDALIRAGLGRGIATHALQTGRPLLTTHFAPALAAAAAGCRDVWCVVTDSDIHRVWAPLDSARTTVRYLTPSMRASRRLQAYGVPAANIHVTGFPLPQELVGGADLATLKRNLAGRLVRLDPTRALRGAWRNELQHFLGELPQDQEGVPPRLTFAVGGAGAQAELVERFLPGLAPAIHEGRWRLALVAGIRREVAARFQAALARHRLDQAPAGAVTVLCADSHEEYFAAFNRLLAETDVLWSKPSEITFFGALGVALVLATPVGVHESYNRRWAREHGACLKQRDARFAHQWLVEWLDDGLLAGAAWSGYLRLPKFGLQQIRQLVTRAE